MNLLNILAMALSLMIFFAIAMQCMNTLSIVKRETNRWIWPLFVFGYMTTIYSILLLG